MNSPQATRSDDPLLNKEIGELAAGVIAILQERGEALMGKLPRKGRAFLSLGLYIAENPGWRQRKDALELMEMVDQFPAWMGWPTVYPIVLCIENLAERVAHRGALKGLENQAEMAKELGFLDKGPGVGSDQG